MNVDLAGGHAARPQKSIEAVQRRVGHRDIFGQCHVSLHQPQCLGVRIWQDPVGKVCGEQMRQFGLESPFVGNEQQIDHAAAGIQGCKTACKSDQLTGWNSVQN